MAAKKKPVKARSRDRHQPGRDSNSHESRQSAAVGKAGKAVLNGSPASKDWARNTLKAGEKKMSISAGKNRETHRGTIHNARKSRKK